VLFVPLKVSPTFVKQEKLLRKALTARMLATGKVTAAVSAETEEAVAKCVRDVNKDANAQQCWVRIGQGQGALMMVTAEIEGTAKGCTVSAQITELETRVSPRMHLKLLDRCGRDDLLAEMARAALVLTGQAGAAPAGGMGSLPAGRSAQPIRTLPPPPDHTASVGRSGPAPPPPASAVGSLSVTGTPDRARVDISGPAGFNGGKPLATTLPLFPPQTVPAGEYRVQVSAPDYVRFDQRRLIPALGTWAVEVALKPSIATLLLSGEPAGAETRVRCGPGYQSRPRNVTQEPFGLPAEPLELLVPAGPCRVEASFVGWQDVRQDLTLSGGERKSIHIRLQQKAPPPVAEAAGTWTQPGTGLTWMRKDNGADVTWHKAKAFCGQATTGGASDWRLPTYEELKRLGDTSRRIKCGGLTCQVVAPLVLSNHWMWSSTPTGEGKALILNFTNISRGSNNLGDTRDPHRAICVRGNAARAQPSGHTWTQPGTGLTWMRKDNGADVTWHKAQAFCAHYCASMATGGGSPWKLPTRDELKGIYDPKRTISCGDTACHVVAPVSLSNKWIWTRSPDGPERFFILNFATGSFGSNTPTDTSDPHRVLCVRRGR